MVMTKGESMRKARNRAKLSAAQLSRISGVPAVTIYALERGTARNGRIIQSSCLQTHCGLASTNTSDAAVR